MSYPHNPYEVEVHDPEGYVDRIASYRTELQAIQSMPAHLAKAQAEAIAHPDWYEGCFFKLVKHEVDGCQEWHEPIQDFPIFS